MGKYILVDPYTAFYFIALGEDAYLSRLKEAYFKFWPEVLGPSVMVVFARCTSALKDEELRTSFTNLSSAKGFLTNGTPRVAGQGAL